MKNNLLKIYEGFFDDLDQLNKNQDDEFGGINSQVYDEHDFILSQDKNPEFFEGLCYMCRKYYPNLPSNENGFTQNDLNNIIETYNNYNGFSYFENVTSLDELQYFHNLENIYFFSFYRCEKLKSIIFPKNLKIIKSFSFSYCSSLKELIFPENLEMIDYNSFDKCYSLKELIFPENIQIIRDQSFGNCFSLKEITIPKKFKNRMDPIFYKVDLTKINITYI